jgi:non-canonical purine NTP pyrophosphatase (RdgB/HAM1 family)
MQKLLFATGSADKLGEVQAILPTQVEQLAVELEEIQSLDLREVVAAKLKSAFEQCHSPVVVEDVSAELEALGGFPGTFVKFAEKTNGDSALYKMLLGHDNKKALIRAMVGYHDGTDMHFFEGKYSGTIVEPRGTGGFGFDKVVVPDGQEKTMAEMTAEQKNSISHRYLAFTALAEYLRS